MQAPSQNTPAHARMQQRSHCTGAAQHSLPTCQHAQLHTHAHALSYPAAGSLQLCQSQASSPLAQYRTPSFDSQGTARLGSYFLSVRPRLVHSV